MQYRHALCVTPFTCILKQCNYYYLHAAMFAMSFNLLLSTVQLNDAG